MCVIYKTNNLNILLSVRLNEHNTNNNDIDNSLLSESNSSRGANSNNNKTMKSNHSSIDYGNDSSSGRFSTAFNRLKYNYDYKPLVRTFTRRFDSPIKVFPLHLNLVCSIVFVVSTNDFLCREFRKRHHQQQRLHQKTKKRHHL